MKQNKNIERISLETTKTLQSLYYSGLQTSKFRMFKYLNYVDSLNEKSKFYGLLEKSQRKNVVQWRQV